MNENVIIVDADFVDKVAFDLTVNFERMLERQIPRADMARWAECLALDGGLRAGEHQTTMILVHDHNVEEMKNFHPGHYVEELDGQAFKSSIGEFVFCPTSGETFVSKDDLFLDTLRTVMEQKEVERIMVVPDDRLYNNVREILRKADDESKRVTVFAMQPMPGGPFQQEILGYSLMAALGIRGEEIEGIKN
ncbi:MAG: hypothetical protein K2H97_09200 [Prevotella sp.]|nr:hypothetical protein [Prevotella sp.]